jgi:hypothetical protein
MSRSILQSEPRCSQATVHALDFAAAMLVTAGVGLAIWGSGDSDAGERHWSDLAFAAAGATVMVGALIATLLRRRDEDEYARRLLGQATMTGFYVTLTAFVTWLPLADGWVAAPTADQLFGLLLAGTGLGYFIARVRGVW